MNEYMRNQEGEYVEMSEHEEFRDGGLPVLRRKSKDKQEPFFIDVINNCQDGKEIEDLSTDRPMKRTREEDGLGWTKVEKKIKKQGQIKNEIIISSKEKLPKQFAIAKLFTSLNFIDIIKIKYINPYRIKIEVPNEDYGTKVINCSEFEKRGWRIHREMEVNVSHGIIRNVDLELTEEQTLEYIKCPNNVQVLAFKRLKRRTEVGEWIPCEVARIDFKCSYLPAYIYVDNLRVKVDPYIFSVTQCSRCWKFDHPKARCAARVIVCPKCCGPHKNCETIQNKCVNCNGDHMALKRTFPIYVREKRLRELMAEFNCSYKKACNLYVAPESIIEPHQTIKKGKENQDINTSNSFMNLPCDENTTHKYTPLLPEFSEFLTLKRPKSSPSNNNSKRVTIGKMNESERDRCNQPDYNSQRSSDDPDAKGLDHISVRQYFAGGVIVVFGAKGRCPSHRQISSPSRAADPDQVSSNTKVQEEMQQSHGRARRLGNSSRGRRDRLRLLAVRDVLIEPSMLTSTAAKLKDDSILV